MEMTDYYAKRASEYEDIYLKPERQSDLKQLQIRLSEAFRGLDHDARQQQVWKYLEDALTPEEMRHLGPIVTLTPAEAEIDVAADA